jgi:hypothetical protein
MERRGVKSVVYTETITFRRNTYMKSIRTLLLGAASLAMLGFAAPAAASAAAAVQVAQASTCHVSLTGTVTRVISPTQFSMHVNNQRVGSIHVIDTNARVNTHGLRLAAGNYAGVYGCFTGGQRSFQASEVTLAGSASAYRSYATPDYASTAATGAGVGPCHVSLFGTVTETMPNGVEFGMDTLRSPIGNIHVYDKDARVNSNGLSVRPGVFAGLYGCFIQNGRAFHAEEVTLATSAQAYSAYRRPTVAVTGTIDEVRNGWIGVSTRYYGHVHVYTTQSGLRTGERVSIQGTFNPAQSSIDANSVAII